jgi:hypothetical protein
VSSVKQRHEEGKRDYACHTGVGLDVGEEKSRARIVGNKNCCEKKRVVVGLAIHGIQLTNALIP